MWDVGHQAYPHKVLTGRRDQLRTIKLKNGLAPFPTRSRERIRHFRRRPFEHVDQRRARHGDRGRAQRASARRVVAVIGDGALSAGMAFEALNHAGSMDVDMLVILNDNDMSISENVGAFSNYFARVLSGKLYATLRKGGKKVLSRMPTVWELARRSEEHMKGMVLPGTIFEEMGFNYIGPVDGHDLKRAGRDAEEPARSQGPAVPARHHAQGQGLRARRSRSDQVARSRPVRSEERRHLQGEGERPVVLADLRPMAVRHGASRIRASSASRRRCAKAPGWWNSPSAFRDRYFDVAIAEQHAVTLAAGMACEGLRPVVAIYSTFLQRAYDQLIHDVALQNLPVTFAIDRAGLVGGDGATHQGSYDLSYLRCIPNLVVMAPADENECRQMLFTASQLDQPAAVRYPRGQGPGVAIESAMRALPVGKAQVRREGRSGLAILAVGAMVPACERIAEQLDATLVNLRFVKPLDEELIVRIAAAHRALVTVEENVVAGGAGSAINECLAANGHGTPTLNLGIPDRFIEHGSREDCLAAAGLDRASVEGRDHALVAGREAVSGRRLAVSAERALSLYWRRPH